MAFLCSRVMDAGMRSGVGLAIQSEVADNANSGFKGYMVLDELPQRPLLFSKVIEPKLTRSRKFKASLTYFSQAYDDARCD